MTTQRKTIATLEDEDCRWPIGDPRRPDFHFCGDERVPGLPYCPPHALRAYAPPQPSPPAVEATLLVLEAVKQKQLEAA